jgi:hypothetical protein
VGGKGRSGFRFFLHSEYKHVLLLSIHLGLGRGCIERNVQGVR